MRKINCFQILVHFVATCFFSYSFTVYSSIYNIKILKLALQNGAENVLINSDKFGLTTYDIWNFSYVLQIFGIIGIFFAFIISILISIKNKWSIWNSTIVLILSLMLHRFGFLGWNYVKIYLSPGRFLDNLLLGFWITFIFLLLIGLSIFFSKFLKIKIENVINKQMNC